jgi:predicted transcriptional regulator
MAEDTPQPSLALEREKLELERYKIRLDYKKFVLGSVFVALAIAAIPPLFQLASAVLEYVKSNRELQVKQQEFHDQYIKDFINNALNQDIELRIRFAQYFAHVATESSREDWVSYLKELTGTRDNIRDQIDTLEKQWILAASRKDRDEAEVARLQRRLDWAYNEVGYVAKNRSAAVNPRAPESGPAISDSPPPWLATMRTISGTEWSPREPIPSTIADWIKFIYERYPDTKSYLSAVESDAFFSWSGLAVAYSMASAGIKPVFGATATSRFLFDPAWLNFGTPVDTPQPGDVLIFDFGGGDHHVGLFEALTQDGSYVTRGGNQSHQVRLSTFPKNTVQAIRRPPQQQEPARASSP